MTDSLIDGSLTALSAQWGYIVYSKKYVAVKKIESEKVENVTCWEYAKWIQ